MVSGFWRALKLWVVALVLLWALCVIATSGSDPAGPLACLLIVTAGALIVSASSLPREDRGRISQSPRMPRRTR